MEIDKFKLLYNLSDCVYVVETNIGTAATLLLSQSSVFTDGSVQGEKSGCAIWSSNFHLKASLSIHSSINTAELYAMKYITNLNGTFIVYTDCYNAVVKICQTCAC